MSTTLAPAKASLPLAGSASSSGHPNSSGSAREAAISAATNYAVNSPPIEFTDTLAQDYYSANVFSKSVMKDRLPTSVYKSVMMTVESGENLDPGVADIVASAMKDWAIEKGATHYAHIFYRLTGATAEKQDSFLPPTSDGSTLSEFSGKQLIQGEPDGSSFSHLALKA